MQKIDQNVLLKVMRNIQLQVIETQKFKETQVEKEAEVTTFFISETNLRNCPHIHFQVANETIVLSVDSIGVVKFPL
jgi:hypothetical protein